MKSLNTLNTTTIKKSSDADIEYFKVLTDPKWDNSAVIRFYF